MNKITDKGGDDCSRGEVAATRKSSGNKITSRVIHLLHDRNLQAITHKEQYTYKGFESGHNELLYTEDFTLAPGYHVALNRDHFMWNDIAMGKGSGFPKQIQTLKLGNKTLRVVIQKNQCMGVKKCCTPSCNYAISN